MPYLIDYLNDDRFDELARATAVETMVQYAPNDPAVTSAITRFIAGTRSLKTKLGQEARETALNGIVGLGMPGGPLRCSPGLVELIVDLLKDDLGLPKKGPQASSVSMTGFLSISALGRCGSNAFPLAQPVLEAIAADEHVDPATRATAQQAIDSILRSPHN